MSTVVPADGYEPPQAPAPGTLVVDTSCGDRVGEFREVVGPCWSLRPVSGGPAWEAAPQHVRAASPSERLHAITARQNARSRGELL